MSKKLTKMTNKAGTVFQLGEKVELNIKALRFQTQDPKPPTFAGRRITKTQITSLLPNKGLVLLEVRLGGYWAWSVDDLEKAR